MDDTDQDLADLKATDQAILDAIGGKVVPMINDLHTQLMNFPPAGLTQPQHDALKALVLQSHTIKAAIDQLTAPPAAPDAPDAPVAQPDPTASASDPAAAAGASANPPTTGAAAGT